jgi:hypothetical protein
MSSMSCTVCIVGPSGRQLKMDVLETNGQALVQYLRAIPSPRHLCFEEGTQSAWLHEILSPHVDELVVMGVTHSRGAKSDAKDALGLAQALRLGAFETTVFKGPTRFARQRFMATSYDQTTHDVIRTQARLEALFRARGHQAPGLAAAAALREAARSRHEAQPRQAHARPSHRGDLSQHVETRGDLRPSTASSAMINVRQSEFRHDLERSPAARHLLGEHGSKASIHGTPGPASEAEVPVKCLPRQSSARGRVAPP